MSAFAAEAAATSRIRGLHEVPLVQLDELLANLLDLS